MKFSREEINDMQEYIKDKLELLSMTHTYPKEEKILTKLLLIITNLRIEE